MYDMKFYSWHENKCLKLYETIGSTLDLCTFELPGIYTWVQIRTTPGSEVDKIK